MDFQTADKAFIREINKSTILKVIREKGPISRADIAKLTGLNPATVTNNVNILLEADIITETGIGDSSGGRKPILLELNKNAFYAIGVDMGLKRARAALINLCGEIIKSIDMPYGNSIDEKDVIKRIIELVNALLDVRNIDKNKILGIGIGVHGIVNPVEGISIYAPKFGWKDVAIKDIFEKEFRMPVLIDNDVRVMALGEKWFGNAKSAKDFVFINVGSGIGSAIVINGDIYRGSLYGAGEIGHISIAENGPKCNCGNFGCLEVMASGTALEKRVIHDINLGKESIIPKLAGDDLSKITGEIIYEAAKLNDKLALDALYDVGSCLGYAVSNLINILNPEIIIIGGGVARAGDFVLKPLCDTAHKKSMEHLSQRVRILPSYLNENCGIIGAATLILNDLFEGSQK
ncbi:transcriptional regulator, MarR family [Caloramator quimbayensis]|uniref:Transcriptional regulator, MarR family n=1 Tax=Caloramator quimbayensis TaxID=1147123 RepID=A0A1T4XUD9_9CLOT|nr:ROK family transcriptional regulator [Caloramator quimbayensis]SKA93189.1 transcriptional regulator, MarR family [Caloramator quimbayensis]